MGRREGLPAEPARVATALFKGEKGSHTGTDCRIPSSCCRSSGARGVSRDQAAEAPEVEGRALVLLLEVRERHRCHRFPFPKEGTLR